MNTKFFHYILHKKAFLLFLCAVSSIQIFSQQDASVKDSALNANKNLPSIDYLNPKQYEIAEITISGKNNYEDYVLIGFSGLSVGQKITIPSDDISNVIKRFWKQGLFSNVQVEIVSVLDNKIWLNIQLDQRPKVSQINFHGVKKKEKEELEKSIGLSKGSQVSPYLIDKAEKHIKNYFIEKGYFYTSANIKVQDDPKENTSVVDIGVDKKLKVKVDHLIIKGNNNLSTRKVDAAMKKTNDKHNILNFFRSKKFLPKEFENDKITLIEKYNELGYRNAEIVSDSVSRNSDNKTVNVYVTVNEGTKYHFGNITWIGNSIYSTDFLNQVLGIKRGEIYNQKRLNQRISEDEDCVNNLYLNNGYLFFNLQTIEKSVRQDSIDFEMRITEGRQATINKVDIIGSDYLYENVVRRELRTKPGDLFNKSDIMRSMREIAATGHFATEQGKMDIKVNPNMSDGTVDLAYVLESKRNDQIELSAGYGSTGVVGTVSLKFTNFSIQNIFNGKSYRPLPQGDGQTLTLKAQTNGMYYQSYSVSFLEPWLGGKRPNSLSLSAYYSIQTGVSSAYSSSYSSYYSSYYDSNSYNSWYSSSYDPDKYIKTLGLSAGLGTRLNWPDDYFSIYGQLSYQNYNLSNWEYFAFETGHANNLNLSLTLSRNSLDQPIYTRKGSDISFSVASTLPYSLFDNKDYSTATDAEKYAWIEYYKIKIKGKLFTPISSNSKLVLLSRAEYGFLGYYDINRRSPFETFYMGGDGTTGYSSTYATETVSLRGYSNGSLTPYYSNGSYAGNLYTKLSMELRYPLLLQESSVIWILGFVEAGNCWTNFDEFNPFELKRSAGIGLRLYMPMFGLLGIDWGYGFDEINGSSSHSGSQFHFVIGQEF